MKKIWKNEADISRIDPAKPMVALSFDDGPVSPVSDRSTGIRIQNALRDGGMHATFFYWGVTCDEGSVEEIRRAQALGFEIANHTKSHPHLPALSAEEMKAEVAYMDRILKEVSGRESFLLRPPYLDIDPVVLETLEVPLITCGIDTRDWAQATAEEMIDLIHKACEDGSLDGQIVLMHETHEATAEAVEALVPYLKERGYQIVTISQMYKARGREMYSGTVYPEN